MSFAIRSYNPKSWHVGLDLGSTFTAVGFCPEPKHIDDFNPSQDIKQVRRYPRGTGYGSGKSSQGEIPTELYYPPDDEQPLIGNQAAHANKYSRTAGVHVGLFKPLLHERGGTECQRRQIAAKIASLSGENTVDRVTTDFLEILMRHVKAYMIMKGLGSYDERDRVHLTCTVPVIWPLRSKRRLEKACRDACKRADFHVETDISIWSEPEAATAFVLATKEDLRWKASTICS